MPALIQFVDSISASPTVRLDVNDGVAWFCGDFSAPPPRLRRSESSNSMRDGGVVGSSSYENRTLTLSLTLINTSTEDAAATEMQKLWRELDRSTNYLRYQREGMTKPVFFRLFRSDAANLEELWTAPIARDITVELLAEPFALGVRETLGPYTISNDPAAASNPGYVDISGVLGDVPAEAIYWNTTYNRAATVMAIRHGDFSDLRPHQQAETMTLGANTANPGGGPDAALSGTGTNNYVRTTFASSAWAMRLWSNTRTTITTQRGSWVIYGVVRRTDSTSVIKVGVSASSTTEPTEKTTVPLSTSRQLVRLGRHTTSVGSNYSAVPLANPNWYVWAARESGTGNIDWDCFFLVPADAAVLEALSHSATGSSGGDNVFDGVADRAMSIVDGGNPVGLATEEGPVQASGRIPQLVPNVTNRMFYLTSSQFDTTGLRVHSKAETNDLTIYYWPRYLFVRPVLT